MVVRFSRSMARDGANRRPALILGTVTSVWRAKVRSKRPTALGAANHECSVGRSVLTEIKATALAVGVGI